MSLSQSFKLDKWRTRPDRTFEHAISALNISATPFALLDLPPEIHVYLIQFLAWPTIINIRLTCSQLANTITKESLQKIHERCSVTLLAKEQEVAAELTDKMRSNWAETQLPCYRCHRWMNSGGGLKNSAFTRGRGTDLFGPGGIKASERFCLQCGIRSGFYARGTLLSYRGICYNCGVYTSTRRPSGHWYSNNRDVDKRWSLDARKYYRRCYEYCSNCISRDDVLYTGQRITHERFWGPYEKGMKAGKEYRNQQGRRLRQERGIQESDQRQVKQYQPKHFCPIMEEMRFCSCWKDLNDHKMKATSADEISTSEETRGFLA